MARLRPTRSWGLAGFAIATGLSAGAALGYTAPYSTPPGILLVDVSSGTGTANPTFLWRRLGDGTGKALYTYDADQPGKSSCYAECAKEFPPFAADAHAKDSGDFSILVRDDHVRQWAYQGKALYRYSGKDPAGEANGRGGDRVDAQNNGVMFDPASKIYSPKEGWRRVAFAPEKSTPTPPDIQLDAQAVASGFGFVEAATHMTIYAAPISHKLSSAWRPVRASALAAPVGDFSIVDREDYGARQWTYKGEALYTYAGDYAPGDVTGIFIGDKKIQAALVYRNFMPPGIEVGQYVGRAPLLAAKGLTLYYVSRFHALFGGRLTRTGYSITYNDAKSQGADGCQTECTQSWKPVLASENAEASGFWEIVTRADGGKQWAFKGSPVYTFVGDKKSGDIAGNNRSVVLYGGTQGEVVYSSAGGDPRYMQPRLGKIDMAFAVGRSADDDAGGRRPARARTAGAGGAAAGAGQAAGADDPGGGAGLYWHTLGLFY